MVDTTRAQFPPDMFRAAQQGDLGQVQAMAEDVVDSVTSYVKEKPGSALLWALGVGFILGWRLKPW